MDAFVIWIGSSWLHNWINLSPWAYPAMEIVHFTGLSILFGSLLLIDLRVAGFASFTNNENTLTVMT